MEETGGIPPPRRRKIHPMWQLCIHWYEVKAPPVVRRIGGKVGKAPNEAFIMSLAIVFAILVYLVQMTVVLPNIWKDWNGYFLLASLLGATWMMYGIFAHLYVITYGAPVLPAIVSMPLELLPVVTFESEVNGDSGLRVLRKRCIAGGDSASNNNNMPDNRICTKCNASVPMDAWHCNNCNRCVPEKNTHLCDVKNQKIYGQRDHASFLGVLLYLGVGGMSACVSGCILAYMREGSNWWIVTLKCILYWNAIFNIPGYFTLIAGIGGLAALLFFKDYAKLIQKTQNQNPSIKKTGIYGSLKDFLGLNAFRRILFPLICTTQNQKERSE